MSKEKRVEYIDISKGLSMLMVIIGHTITIKLIRGIIFSFHMPMFFFCSGYTERAPVSWTDYWYKLKHWFLRLVVPAICMFLIRAVLSFLLYENGLSFTEICRSIFMASGITIPEHMFLGGTMPIGMTWFLIAMFIAKAIYGFMWRLRNISKVLICSILLTVGIICPMFQWLPFSLDVSMVSAFFISMGNAYKEYNKNEMKVVRALIL